MRRNLLALTAILAVQSAAFEAGATCTAANPNSSVLESTPTSAFTVHGDGTVTHGLTGLMWKQCAQGRSGANCANGTAVQMIWSAALAAAVADTTAGRSDWRLPNTRELEYILEFCGTSPAINQTVFPATPASVFWSGSSKAPSPNSAWSVDFTDGATVGTYKLFEQYVRLVRGGQYVDAFDAQDPTAFIANLDVDASITASKYDAPTDGLLLIRYLFGLTGPALTAGAVGGTATRTSSIAIKNHLDNIRLSLDVDDNGQADALTDGLLILRYMFGLRDISLITGVVDPLGTRKTATEIETYIQALMP